MSTENFFEIDLTTARPILTLLIFHSESPSPITAIMTVGTRIIRAPRGSALSCTGRPQEAALDAFDIPGFVPEHVRPAFHEGKGSFHPDDIFVTDQIELDQNSAGAVVVWP